MSRKKRMISPPFSVVPSGMALPEEYSRRDDCARRERAAYTRETEGKRASYARIHDSCTAGDMCTQRETRNTRSNPAWPFDVHGRTLTPRQAAAAERRVSTRSCGDFYVPSFPTLLF